MLRENGLKSEPQRVGMIIRRDKPSRLVHRFGYVMPERTSRLDPSRYGSVQWDDGELDLVEWERLMPMSEMNENPMRLPTVSYEDEIGGFGIRSGMSRRRA